MPSCTPLDTLLSDYPDIRYLDVFYPDLSCVFRGKRYPVEQAEKIFDTGMMTPGSSFLLSVTGESMDPEGMGFSDGDPDEMGMPLIDTLVPAPWTQVPTAQVMLTLQSLNGTPFYYEPRNVLKRVLEKFESTGIRPMVAFELEFYLLDARRNKPGELTPPRSPLTGQVLDATQVYGLDDIEDFSRYLDQVTSICAQQGISTGAISSEYAPGQFEINLQHDTDVLRAADHCLLFRRVVQCVARQHGYRATFMAKPYSAHAGSGLHLHISLLDKDGKNIFDGGGRYATPACGSDRLYHGLGGLKALMYDSMGIFAPNVNAYHRFSPNSYVPVTPSWGYENRSVAMRIPKSPGNARRLEHRVSGADANPYLTLAVLLASIHYGLTRQLNPGDPVKGNAGTKVDPDLPLDLVTAMERLRHSQVLSDYLGQDYLNAYTSCKLNEYHAFVDSDKPEADWYL